MPIMINDSRALALAIGKDALLEGARVELREEFA
jgi:hypothetical protein